MSGPIRNPSCQDASTVDELANLRSSVQITPDLQAGGAISPDGAYAVIDAIIWLRLRPTLGYRCGHVEYLRY
jgi:hypothetical protein